MTAKITVEMDNAAFDNNESAELARILFDLAGRLTDGLLCADEIGNMETLRDINGNKVGEIRITR